MHPKTSFIWGKYRPKWSENAQNRENLTFQPNPPSQYLKMPFKTVKSAYLYLKHAQTPQKYILEQVLSEGSITQNSQKVLKIAKIHYFTRGLSRPSPICKASQDLKIPSKTLKSAYFYLKHAQIPQKYTLEQVLSQGSTAQICQKTLEMAKIHYFTIVLSRPSPIFRASQDLKIPSKTLKSAYFYLKHAQIPQEYILKQVLFEGSTAQNGQKMLKITKIHYFTRGLSRPSPIWRASQDPRKTSKSRLKLSNWPISTSNMHK